MADYNKEVYHVDWRRKQEIEELRDTRWKSSSCFSDFCRVEKKYSFRY